MSGPAHADTATERRGYSQKVKLYHYRIFGLRPVHPEWRTALPPETMPGNPINANEQKSGLLTVRSVVVAAVGFLILVMLLRPVTTDKPISGRIVNARRTAVSLMATCRAYASDHGSPPTGNYSEIVAALRGNNPRKIVYFEAGRKEFTPTGELVDPGGSPYVINRSDPANPRFYSVGPNKVDDGDTPGSDDIDPKR